MDRNRKMSQLKKVKFERFGGLTFTLSAHCTMSDEEVERHLFEGIFGLLSFDGNPGGKFDAIEKAVDSGAHEDGRPVCLVAAAMMAQYYTSVLLPAPNSTLPTLLEPSLSSQYEQWEIDFLRAILAFTQRFDFREAADISIKALKETPQNIFCGRFVFLMFYLMSDYQGMHDTFTELASFYANDVAFLPYLTLTVGFSLEELGHLEEALAITAKAQQQVEVLRSSGTVMVDGKKPMHPYLSHTLAHIYLSEPAKALEALDATADLWKGTTLLRCHIEWHRVISLYALGRREEAVAAYDELFQEHVAAETEDLFALSDCCGFLWRAFTDGYLAADDARIVALNKHWARHGQRQATSTGGIVDGVPRISQIPFFDVHYRCSQMMVNVKQLKGTPQHEQLLSSLQGEEVLLDGATDPAVAMRTMALRFLTATIRHLEHDDAAALSVMQQAEESGAFQSMGGSAAQRGLLKVTADYFGKLAKA